MIDPERADLSELIGELRRRYPDWRFGQLVCNLAGWADVDVWDVEDEQLIAAARAHLAGITEPDDRPGAAVSR